VDLETPVELLEVLVRLSLKGGDASTGSGDGSFDGGDGGGVVVMR